MNKKEEEPARPVMARLSLGTDGYAEFDTTTLVRIDGQLMPPEIKAVLPGDDSRPDMDLQLAIVDGQPRCRRATFDIGEDGAYRMGDLGVSLDELAVQIYGLVSKMFDEETGAITMKAISSKRALYYRPRTRRLVTPELLAEVADVYNAADPAAPAKAVMAKLKVARSQAAEYIRQAREAGLIAPLPDRGKS